MKFLFTIGPLTILDVTLFEIQSEAKEITGDVVVVHHYQEDEEEEDGPDLFGKTQ